MPPGLPYKEQNKILSKITTPGHYYPDNLSEKENFILCLVEKRLKLYKTLNLSFLKIKN